ncbi:MAG: choice-of-anchor L domain-containing protein [Bacteroidia bacterium]|nr:choice-of-anchor L domain-containing protein [Bacteroidia bacterium]
MFSPQKNRSLIFAFVLFFINTNLLNAQIIINTNTYTTPNPATSLVNNILLGQGVTASNITFTPSANSTSQLGFFKKNNSNIGLDSGIVLSTGNVHDITPGISIGNVGNFFPTNYPDLLSVANSVPPLINQSFSVGNVYDVAVLEFDFVPSSDTVRFKYVFGSNEYLTFINSSYNDVFGFFISGPGISGPYAGNSKNIAIVPNSNPPLPITISSVQPNLNGSYYINNPTNATVSLNGFTKVFTAMSPVTCGETYHIRIAIADGSDSSLDSGVFLEANSFSSQGVQLSSSINIGGSDTILYEGCGTAIIEMVRPGDISQGDTIHFVISGSPNNGDYTNFADSLVFTPGQQSAFITINAFQDNLVEGLDTITITFPANNCSSIESSITIYVADAPPITAFAGNDTTLNCPGDPATLHASATGGLPGYYYTWLGGLGNTQTIVVNPLVTTSYIVMVEDTCHQVVDYDTVVVNIPNIQPITVTSAPQQQDIICPNDPATFIATASGGTPPYNYVWQTNPPVIGNTATFITPTDQWYVVDVTDACNILHGYDTVRVNLIASNPLTVFLPEEFKICLGESVKLEPQVFGGVKDYHYAWTSINSSASEITVSPINNTIYSVTVSDFCGRTASVSSKVLINYPKADFSFSSDPQNDYRIIFLNESEKPITNIWHYGDGEKSFDIHPEHTYGDSGTYQVKLIMVDANGCTDTIIHDVWVNPDLRVLIPNAFTPNGDNLNDRWEIRGQGMKELSFVIFDRWGIKIYDNGNNVNNYFWEGNNYPQDVYSYYIYAKSFTGKIYEKYGSIFLIR